MRSGDPDLKAARGLQKTVQTRYYFSQTQHLSTHSGICAFAFLLLHLPSRLQKEGMRMEALVFG